MAPAPKPPRAGGAGLHHRIGGLPIWVWAAVVVGGLAVGFYLRRRAASSSPSNASAAGYPVSTGGILGAAGGGGSGGGGTAGVATGIDPVLAGLLSDSNNALVNESGILAGLTAQSIQGVLDAGNAVLQTGTQLLTTPPMTIGSSAAGSSPAGQTGAQTPAPVAPAPSPAPSPAPALVTPDNRPTNPASPLSVAAAEAATKQYAATQPGQTRTAGF